MPPFLSDGINPPLPWAPAGVNPKKLLRKSLGGSRAPLVARLASCLGSGHRGRNDSAKIAALTFTPAQIIRSATD